MVKVATRTAENPMAFVAKKLHLGNLGRDNPKLSLPGKLVFPRYACMLEVVLGMEFQNSSIQILYSEIVSFYSYLQP